MTCIPDLLSPPEEFAKAVQSLADSIQERQMEYIEFHSPEDDTVRRIPIFGATRIVGNCGPELFMPGPLDGMKPGSTRRLSEMWPGTVVHCNDKFDRVQNFGSAPQQKPKALPAISGLTTVQDGRYQAWRDTQ